MTGAIYGRDPAEQNTGPLHLWEPERDSNDGTLYMISSCGELRCEVVEKDNSSIRIVNSQQMEKELGLLSTTALKESTTGYCEKCLQHHPIASRQRLG